MTTNKMMEPAGPSPKAGGWIAPTGLLSKGEVLRRANSRFDCIFEDGKTEIRVLIVADGEVNFSDDDFGLSELIDKALKPSPMPWERLEIVKAYRSADNPRAPVGADVCEFRFDEKPERPYDRPLSDYDQIWLFGYNGEGDGALSPSEVRALAR